MAQLIMSMDYIDDKGQVAANIKATYNNLSYAGVVKMQGAIVGALQGLGEQAAQAKSDAQSD